MANPSAKEFQQITEELYKKNLDLVNANKELSLTQKLYEIMAKNFTVEHIAQKFIVTIVKDLEFVAGSVSLKEPKEPYLRAVAATQTPMYERIFRMIGRPLPELKVSLSNQSNLSVKAYKNRRRHVTHKIYDLLTPLVSEEVANKIDKISNVQSIIVFPLTFGKKSLGVFTISLSRKEQDLTENEKKILNRVAIVFGVAIDRATIYQDLKFANKRLRQLDKLKDEFLSVAGHELRTPMTAIKSYLWMLLNKKQKEDRISAKTQRYMDQAYQSTERLIALVNDMLDVSRIESGRVELHLAPLNMQDLVTEVMDEVLPRAQEGKLELKLEPLDGMPQVRADKDKIHQVLLNLIGNSLKFTPQDGKITVSFKKTDGFLETAVTDTGKGIAKEDMPRLFTKFGRLEGSYTSIATNKGTGLGLYLCKQYVEKMEGKIEVDSPATAVGKEGGKGATVRFTLPVV